MQPREPVERRDAVSVIVVDEGRVLLVKRANPPAHNLYAFPGGSVDPGETLEAAALRELTEETGLLAKDPEPYRVYDLMEKDDEGIVTSHFLLTVFTASLAERSRREPVAADDALEASWYDRAAALALPMPESVRECVAAVLEDEPR